MARRRRSRSSLTLTGIAGAILVVVVAFLRSYLGIGGPSSAPTAVPGGGSSGDGGSSGNGNIVVPGGELPWLKVYFTNPNPPDQPDTGIDQFVVPVLNAAQKSIDVTSFDFTLPSVT